MITLTKTNERGEEVYTFTKSTLVIGNSHSADLTIDDAELEADHIRITKSDDGYVAYNHTNDPFATINGLPFGKKQLHPHDIISIGKTRITFDCAAEPKSSPAEKSPEERYAEEMRLIEEASAASETFDEAPSIEALITAVEKLEAPEGQKERDHKAVTLYDLDDSGSEEAQKIFHSQVAQQLSSPSGEEEQLRESEAPTEAPPAEPQLLAKSLRHRKLLLICSFITAFTLLFISAGVYSRLTTKSRQDEIAAARGVADIAMGLTYAQIHNHQPNQQNWSDPQFLKTTIGSVLTPYQGPEAQVDVKGHLNKSPYLIRIYTNRDLSRFLIIAQPEASLHQWLAPRKSIIIDSYTMELRKLSDLRTLNRLLVELPGLSNESDSAIADVVQSSELIHLRELKTRNNSNGFEPPIRLAALRPGAENLIYNAPRYSRIGDRVMHEAIDLVTRPSSGNEVKKLTEELRTVAKLPNTILYTSNGQEIAIKAQKALKTLIPEENFLIAYIRYDVTKSSLTSEIVNDTQSPLAYGASYRPMVETVAAAPSLKPPPTSTNKLHVKQPSQPTKTPFGVEVDSESPLFLEIATLAELRQQTLSEMGTKLIQMLEEHSSHYVPEFFQQFDALYNEYRKQAALQREQTLIGLKALYAQYHVPLATFDAYVNAAGLKGFDTTTLKKLQNSLPSARPPSEALLARYLNKILQSDSFQQLDEVTTVTTMLLTLDKLPDAPKVIDYQNQIRNATIERLEEFLFSEDTPLTRTDFTPENREILQRILSTTWILDPEERAFYLGEFDSNKE